jgi:general secretion pathway protein I
MTLSMRRFKGFTLLEVVVALAILGVSLVAILNINAQSIQAHQFSKRLTVATLLARGKMVDLEQKLHDEPMPVDDEEEGGDFSEEGWPMMKWRAKIIAPKTNGLSPDQLIGALLNLPLGGDSKDGQGGVLSGLFSGAGGKAGAKSQGAGAGAIGGAASALGPMAGLAQGQFTQMVDQLQKSVREVHLTVSWKEGRQTETIDLVTHVVSLGPGSDRNGGAAAANGQAAGGPAGEQWVRPDGTPVANPQPGPNGAGMVDPRDNTPLIPAAQFQGGARGSPAGVPGAAGVPGGPGRPLNPFFRGAGR